MCFPLTARTCDNAPIHSTPWSRPAAGHVKLNTDGSILDGIDGIGMLLRDHTGGIVFSSC